MAKLEDYLSPIYNELKEQDGLYHAENPEFDRIHDRLHRILLNKFVLEADLEGIEQLEIDYSVTPEPGDDLEIRRQRLLAKLTSKNIYTDITLRRMLNNILGHDGYTIEQDELELFLGLLDHTSYMILAVIELLDMVVPMNVLMRITQNKSTPTNIYLANYAKIGVIDQTIASQENVEKDIFVYTGGIMKLGYKLWID